MQESTEKKRCNGHTQINSSTKQRAIYLGCLAYTPAHMLCANDARGNFASLPFLSDSVSKYTQKKRPKNHQPSLMGDRRFASAHGNRARCYHSPGPSKMSILMLALCLRFSDYICSSIAFASSFSAYILCVILCPLRDMRA